MKSIVENGGLSRHLAAMGCPEPAVPVNLLRVPREKIGTLKKTTLVANDLKVRAAGLRETDLSLSDDIRVAASVIDDTVTSAFETNGMDDVKVLLVNSGLKPGLHRELMGLLATEPTVSVIKPQSGENDKMEYTRATIPGFYIEVSAPEDTQTRRPAHLVGKNHVPPHIRAQLNTR